MYRVKTPDGITDERWYVDPRTAQPLGSTQYFAPAGGEAGQIVTRRLAAYERLPARPENLRRLAAPR